jgi:signal peptidase II
MNTSRPLLGTPNRRIAAIALLILLVDQFTKMLVLRFLPNVWDEKTVVEGFFKFVHWQNTGAAWSSFDGKNGMLALVAVVALVILYFSRHHFNSHTIPGQIAFGLVIGGIMGNLADSAICVGVALVFLMTWRNEHATKPVQVPSE